MLQVIGARELRERFAECLEWVEEGDELVVLVHGRPAARLRAVQPDDDGALVRSRFVRDELHEAIARARVSSLVVTRYNRIVAVLEAAPKSLDGERKEKAS
jgi:prevent-host-death family protein